MAKKETKTAENKLSLIVDFSGFVELPDGVTAEKRAEEIKAELEALKVESIEDKANYEIAREKLTQLVKLRTTIEKVRKEKNGPVTEAKKRIDDTAKALTALFQTAEAIAEKKVKDFTKWEEEIKNFRANQLKARQELLISNGFPFNGEHFVCIIEGETICAIAPKQISMSGDAEWDELLASHINPAIEKWKAFKEEETRLFNDFKAKQEQERNTSNQSSQKAEYPVSNDGSKTANFIPHTKEVIATDTLDEAIEKLDKVLNAEYDKQDVIAILQKVLSSFKALQKGPSPQTMQLEAIIESEIKKL